ncbi:hypothetical protein PspLS_00612 [Pyricularia sp. CBS 133598]|nr:hypothetical protein PspLS_00612 [Pyricularia sp. CBS 133598]
MASTTLLRGRGLRAVAIGAAAASAASSWRTIATYCLSHKPTDDIKRALGSLIGMNSMSEGLYMYNRCTVYAVQSTWTLDFPRCLLPTRYLPTLPTYLQQAYLPPSYWPYCANYIRTAGAQSYHPSCVST